MSEYRGEKTSSRAQTVAHLEEMVRLGAQVVSNLDFDHTTPLGQRFLRHVATDYVAEVDGIDGSLSFEQVNAVWAEKAKLVPRTESKITAIWTEFENGGRAKVYAEYATRGWESSIETELKAFGISSWRLSQDGVWEMYRFQGMRIGGSSHLTQSLP